MKSILILSFCVFPLFSHANYLKLAGSLSANTKIEEETTGISLDVDSKSLHPFLVAIGMSIGPMALEIEAVLRHDEDDTTGFALESQHLGLNLAANLTGGKFMISPYLGGGVVAGLYTIDPVDEQGFGVATQIFGGATFKVTSFFHIGAEVRFLTTVKHPKFDMGPSSEIELKYKNTSYMLTTMLHF